MQLGDNMYGENLSGNVKMDEIGISIDCVHPPSPPPPTKESHVL